MLSSLSETQPGMFLSLLYSPDVGLLLVVVFFHGACVTRQYDDSSPTAQALIRFHFGD